ncbi:hypothetical protein ACE1CB_25635 [Aerosakkonema sp. BLCC-F2]
MSMPRSLCWSGFGNFAQFLMIIGFWLTNLCDRALKTNPVKAGVTEFLSASGVRHIGYNFIMLFF